MNLLRSKNNPLTNENPVARLLVESDHLPLRASAILIIFWLMRKALT
jgi:hypothetical protein